MPTTTSPTFDVTPHLKWAWAIARGVRADYRFQAGSQEEQELEGAAYLTLVAAGRRFDPARVPAGGDVPGAFRGFCARDIRSGCWREAEGLKNAGTYHTRWRKFARPGGLAIHISATADEGGECLDVPEHRPGAADLDWDPVEDGLYDTTWDRNAA